MTLPGMYLVDKSGRRFLLLLGAAGMASANRSITADKLESDQSTFNSLSVDCRHRGRRDLCGQQGRPAGPDCVRLYLHRILRLYLGE